MAEDTPSIDTTPSTATTASAPPPAADAGSSGETTSSPAQSGETGKKPTLLDAVLKVVPADTEGDVLADKATDAPASPAIVSGEQASQGTEGEDDNPTEADTADMKPRMAKKFRTLLNQRSELQRQVADLQQLQPVAEIGGQLANFAQENDLSSDDVVRAVSLAAAVRRGDWQGFYQQVGPFVRRAQEYLGLVLPDDLGQRVQQGHMTEAAAREFARTRFDAARAEAIAGQRETEVQSSRVQHVQADVQRAVTSFETQLASRDPDYRAKADAIRRTTQAILHERGGRISTVQEALDIVQEAHAEVTAQYRRLLPPPRPTNPLPNGNSQQPSARAAPKTLMEAALQGLENSRRERA